MSPIYDTKKQIELFVVGTLLVVALIYGIFRTYPLLSGPKITIYSPNDGDFVASSTFKISGKVLRSREITLQGKHITTDTEGNFTETLVPYYPYTILVLVATDAYGATTTKTIRVIPK